MTALSPVLADFTCGDVVRPEKATLVLLSASTQAHIEILFALVSMHAIATIPQEGKSHNVLQECSNHQKDESLSQEVFREGEKLVLGEPESARQANDGRRTT